MRFPDVFSEDQARVVADLEARDLREPLEGSKDASRLKALAPEVARLLYLLVVRQRASTIVEFGTSHGYSTIHLARAADEVGGHVYTVDSDPGKTGWARENLETSGLLQRVNLVPSRGIDFVSSLPDGIDFVLVDYGVRDFLATFEALRPKLAPGCFVFVDGGPPGYWESEGVREFKQRLEEDPQFVVSIVPMKKDQLIAIRAQ